MPASRYLTGGLSWYGVLIALGMALAILWSVQEEKKLGLPKDTAVDLALWVIPCGIIGARLYYVIFSWEKYAGNPLSILYIWQGGLAIWGGIIGGFLAVLFFSGRRRISLWQLLDMIVPGLALAQGIGRWGNFFNQEAYGIAFDNPCLCFFPLCVSIDGVWHAATFFYESVWDLLVFLALVRIRKHVFRPGQVTRWYLVLYSAGRLVIEGLRTDSLMLMGLRVSQWVSILACAVVWISFLAENRSARGILPLIPAMVLAVPAFFLTQGLARSEILCLIYSSCVLTGCTIAFRCHKAGKEPSCLQ